MLNKNLTNINHFENIYMTLFPFCFVGQGNIGKWVAMPIGMQSELLIDPHVWHILF